MPLALSVPFALSKPCSDHPSLVFSSRSMMRRVKAVPLDLALSPSTFTRASTSFVPSCRAPLMMSRESVPSNAHSAAAAVRPMARVPAS